jgi:L-ascorbate metabolism protein UlaG (beta-lactamase superfamily)
VLETEQSILVFDYWLDPSGVMDSVLRSQKPMYVFSSHFHEDHFTKEIFEWKKQKPNITYILSKDICKHRRAGKEDADVWLAKGGTWYDDNISVWAMGSTDSGVSWIVEIEGKAAIKRVQSQACLDSAEREQALPKVKRIFHAGDLNNWYARFLQDVKPGETIYSEEFDEEIEPIAHEKQYLGELKDIRKITDSFDVVMFPVDGRIGNGYTLGGRQFIERFKVRHFVPMHFVASGFKSAWRMKEFTDEKNISFWKINREGETIEI